MARKPIPPKTAEKLGETQRYLMEMERAGEATETYARRVANFLAAARSVKDVLKNEIASGNKTATAYIKAKMDADPEMKRLITTRNRDQHHEVLALRIEWVPEQFPGRSGDRARDDFFRRHLSRRVTDRYSARSRLLATTRATEMIPRAFIRGIRDRDAFTVCAEHLNKVRKAVDDCVERYG